MANLRSLFCTIPIGSLFEVKHCVEPNFGASEVVGTLLEANIDTVHLDLNAMLIKHRRDTNDVDQLTDTEKSILNNTAKLNEFLNDYTISPRLHEWATYLATNVQTYVTASGDSNIDFICYSLTHTQFKRDYIALAGFNFSIILRKYLDFIPYTVPLYCGGKYMFRELFYYSVGVVRKLGINDPALEDNEIKYLFNYVSSVVQPEYLPLYYILESSHNPVVDTNKTQEDGVVHANGLSKVKLESPSLGSIYAFIDHISNNFNNDKLKITQRINKEITPTIDVVYISLKEGIKQITYMADLKSLNFKDAEVDVVDVWPKELTDTYPEFKTLKPFNYYNYRFTEGCIFKCAFCYHSITDWLIKDEVTAVVDRLERWYDSGIEYMRFFNDNINFKLSWTTEFANEIVKRNIKIKWTDSANLKVGNRDMFMAMGESGCVKLWYGTETYSSRILKEIGKWTDQMYEKIDNTLVWAHEAGIWNAANLIVNFPHETNEEYDELRNFIGDYYNKGIINQMNVQPLAIWEPSLMSVYPEKFRIRLDKNRSMRWQGMPWGARWEERNDDGTVCTSPEEIQKRGDYRFLNALKFTDIPQDGLTTGILCRQFENEYLFFSLIQLYGTDKAKKKEVYHHILDKLSTNNEYHDICQKLIF